MKNENWWKNFAMGLELDAAGAFIYNSIHHLHVIDSLSYSTDIFEFFYGLSVGIERLQKVAIVLLEHNDGEDIEKFEQSLISHNTMELSNRIDRSANLDLSDVHKEFLSLITKFYKTHRYGRYTFSSVPLIEPEKDLFVVYLKKHISIYVPKESFCGIPNTEQIKRFVGKVVKKIVGGLYDIISTRANALNISTNELRFGSKALKVFGTERLDFLNEEKMRKEILLYLMKAKSVDIHLQLFRDFEVLDLDSSLIPVYIKTLISDSPEHLGNVSGEIEALYDDMANLGERFKFLDIMYTDWWIDEEK